MQLLLYIPLAVLIVYGVQKKNKIIEISIANIEKEYTNNGVVKIEINAAFELMLQYYEYILVPIIIFLITSFK